ncbi:vacuolar sorting-associated protein [Perilla frutescens var. frutescens]|nr:vacuolar sorting-associated protein [Perilla frutescens var. frutescens]
MCVDSGSGFATSRIKLGELEVCQITNFEFIWGSNISMDGKHSISFYKPILIPDGFSCLGHYCQSDKKPLRGFVLVAREAAGQHDCSTHDSDYMSALVDPVDYSLVWSSYDGDDENFDGCCYIWLPQPAEGYKALGFVVTNKSKKPELDEVKCVRADLTDTCEAYHLIAGMDSEFLKVPLTVWNVRPLHRGIYGRGVTVGTFYCSTSCNSGEELNIGCLKNLDVNLHAMPNMDQIHALVRHYGPTVFFHPNEVYLPCSVSWFLKNGAVLYSKSNTNGQGQGQAIDAEGSNLPSGGTNDGQYWIDLPRDGGRGKVKHGNIESAKLYLHVKPAEGGSFTDIAMWVFCPFNGPGTLKVGMINIGLTKVGRHVGDWEHFTLRISNFTGELWTIYFSQHSGGQWVDAYDLEFKEGNKAIIYASRNGHATYPHPGTYIQGSSKLGIGVRNDAARSDYYIDSSRHYQIVAAEYLGEGLVKEPCWLQYMRKWGPRIVYDSKTELDKIIKRLPPLFKNSITNILTKLPLELYGEDGPTGPKEKNNWTGDERC